MSIIGMRDEDQVRTAPGHVLRAIAAGAADGRPVRKPASFGRSRIFRFGGHDGRSERFHSRNRRQAARQKQLEHDTLCNIGAFADDDDESIENFDEFLRDDDGRESGAEHDS